MTEATQQITDLPIVQRAIDNACYHWALEQRIGLPQRATERGTVYETFVGVVKEEGQPVPDDCRFETLDKAQTAFAEAIGGYIDGKAAQVRGPGAALTWRARPVAKQWEGKWWICARLAIEGTAPWR